MVVISIIGILSAVVYANFNDAQKKARDAERQANLINLQAAIEQYKLDNGRYPVGCNGTNNWSGQYNSAFKCPGTSAYIDTTKSYDATGVYYDNEYIVDLAPKYISALPIDPKLNDPDPTVSAGSGYVYFTNADQSVYKLMAFLTVESEEVTSTHELKSCDVSSDPNNPNQIMERQPKEYCDSIGRPNEGSESGKECYVATCDIVTATGWSNNQPLWCDWTQNETKSFSYQRARKSYAVWGGYSINPANPTSALSTEQRTEVVVCSTPDK